MRGRKMDEIKMVVLKYANTLDTARELLVNPFLRVRPDADVNPVAVLDEICKGFGVKRRNVFRILDRARS